LDYPKPLNSSGALPRPPPRPRVPAMTNPHGLKPLDPRYVSDDARRSALLAEAERLPALIVNSAAASNAVMLASGYFSPLAGYMTLAAATAVAEKMTLPGNVLWPVPILNLALPDRITPELRRAKRIALRDPNLPGNPVLATQEIQSIDSIPADLK